MGCDQSKGLGEQIEDEKPKVEEVTQERKIEIQLRKKRENVFTETVDMSKENGQNGNWQDIDHIVKKIDYDNLELSLFR